MTRGLIGQIVTPAAGNRVHPRADWCADNAVFAGKYPGDEKYLAWLGERAEHAGRCVFAVAPDVVCDAAATLERSGPMLGKIRAVGYPVALALQNGAERMRLPWTDFDVAFLGGDTEWKIGPAARQLAADARAHGKRVHMGRVNSRRRLRMAAQMGCHSVDGTYLAHGPHTNLPRLLGWLGEIETQGTLW